MQIHEAFSIPVAKFLYSGHDEFKRKILDWYKSEERSTTSHGSDDLYQYRSNKENESLLDSAPPEIIADFKDFWKFNTPTTTIMC